MYRLMFTMFLTLSATQTFAQFLLPEAVCEGIIDEEKVEITVHVDPAKWCLDTPNELGQKSVVSYTTTGEDERGETDIALARTEVIQNAHSTTHIQTLEPGLTLTYEIKDVPGLGKGVFVDSTDSETKRFEVSCSYTSYSLDCSQESTAQ